MELNNKDFVEGRYYIPQVITDMDMPLHIENYSSSRERPAISKPSQCNYTENMTRAGDLRISSNLFRKSANGDVGYLIQNLPVNEVLDTSATPPEVNKLVSLQNPAMKYAPIIGSLVGGAGGYAVGKPWHGMIAGGLLSTLLKEEYEKQQAYPYVRSLGRNLDRKLYNYRTGKEASIVSGSNGFRVISEKGKNLGGPYKNKTEAVKRLRQVEYFKQKSGGSSVENEYIIDSPIDYSMHSGFGGADPNLRAVITQRNPIPAYFPMVGLVSGGLLGMLRKSRKPSVMGAAMGALGGSIIKELIYDRNEAPYRPMLISEIKRKYDVL